jgi:hypothetical protein
MMTSTYPQVEVSPVDALWILIQGQTKAVRAALTKKLVEQERASLAAKAADAKLFTQKIKALENDTEGFFKLGGFMADSSNSADELLEEALTDKYGI